MAARQDPYFALIGGDLAYDNGRSPETFLKFIQNYSQQVVDPQGRLIPLITTIGNHEVNGGYNASAIGGPVVSSACSTGSSRRRPLACSTSATT